MILYCPFCANSLNEPLYRGISFCDKCERMVESNRKNKLLSGFRICLKNTGKNIENKVWFKNSKEDFDIISKYLDECYSCEEFQKEINKLDI